MDIEIRIYELEQDGKLHELSSTPISWYGGICPNVGDVLCSDFTALGVCFYSVQRRYFMEAGGATGWAIIVRRLDPAPQQAMVYETWKEDTEFWEEVYENERREELDEADPPEPIQPPLNWREQKAMEYLFERGAQVRVDWHELKDFGPSTQKSLQKRGFIRASADTDRHGNPEKIWLTKAGQKAMHDLHAHRSKYPVL
ncbi:MULTISPECIES: hypothetical protein [unclassified Sinorhizobium]|uniref:hypothetical protein n=1 Tax=unclassified Sinorhizobium TaxID=2613772 RepID=UPI0024C3206B|nr:MULTISPECIES: hypothetical protein [unclassified Sinorhizobium]MDK1377074.1 hypothetical protein [Sinorhizobium sp. 6-70]MDK1479631.1 hypothetical protein [Sinorhizobium sp. 6-117]